MFLRETYDVTDRYAFLDAGRKAAARAAFDKGIQCILKCQIRVDGKLTAWCAQHDEVDFRPRPGRSYELVSLSGGRVRRHHAVADEPGQPESGGGRRGRGGGGVVRIGQANRHQGRDRGGPDGATGPNKVVVKDVNAPPLWARFYEIGTNRPIFADRDGVAKHELSEIDYERRNGYNWLSDWPRSLLEKEYPAWKVQRAGR